MKKSVVIGIVIVIVVLLLVVITNKFGPQNELVLDEVYDIDFDSVSVDTTSSNVYIMESDDNTAKVKVYGDKNKTDVKTDNNKLKIETKSVFTLVVLRNHNEPKVEIWLPKDFSKTISIKTTAGNLECTGCSDAYIDAKTSSGNVKLESNKQVKIDTTSGNVNLGNIEDANIKVTSGNIKIDSVNKLQAESTSGNIEIKEANLNSNSSISATSGNVSIKSKNDIYVKASAGSGNIKINGNNEDAEVVLKVETTSGNIVVK